MWLMTTFGFFSIVDKPDDDELMLTVRARVRADLEHLRDHYLPTMSAVEAYTGSDYPYRARVERSELAAAMSRLVLELDYANFKDEVFRRQGRGRAHAYGRVWEVLHDLERTSA